MQLGVPPSSSLFLQANIFIQTGVNEWIVNSETRGVHQGQPTLHHPTHFEAKGPSLWSFDQVDENTKMQNFSRHEKHLFGIYAIVLQVFWALHWGVQVLAEWLLGLQQCKQKLVWRSKIDLNSLKHSFTWSFIWLKTSVASFFDCHFFGEHPRPSRVSSCQGGKSHILLQHPCLASTRAALARVVRKYLQCSELFTCSSIFLCLSLSRQGRFLWLLLRVDQASSRSLCS